MLIYAYYYEYSLLVGSGRIALREKLNPGYYLLSFIHPSAYLACTPELLNVTGEKYPTTLTHLTKIHIQQLEVALNAFQQFCTIFQPFPIPFLTLG